MRPFDLHRQRTATEDTSFTEKLALMIELWDVSQAEIHGSHLDLIFENAAGVIFVCNENSLESVHELDRWMRAADSRVNIFISTRYIPCLHDGAPTLTIPSTFVCV